MKVIGPGKQLMRLILTKQLHEPDALRRKNDAIAIVKYNQEKKRKKNQADLKIEIMSQ